MKSVANKENGLDSAKYKREIKSKYIIFTAIFLFQSIKPID